MLKKFLLNSLAIIALCSAVNAQTPLTLTQTQLPLNERAVNVHYVNPANLPANLGGTNASWDLSGLSVTDSSEFNFIATTNPIFGSGLTEVDREEPIVAGRTFFYNAHYQKDAAGLKIAGVSTPAQEYSLYDITSDPDDSFFVLSQSNLFTNPRTLIAFPASMDSAWSSNFRQHFDFMLSIDAMGLDKAPGTKVTNFSQVDVVTGWGKMKIPRGNNFFDVLKINRAVMRIDSFYLYNMPADPTMLGMFGLKQADTSYMFYSLYYRAEDFYPLMSVGYGNDSTLSAPTFAYFTPDMSASIASHNEKLNSASFYPNPANGNDIQVRFTKDDKTTWNITLTNILGQRIYNRSIKQSGELNLNLDLNSSIQNGIYLLNITDENGKVKAFNKLILTR